MAIRSPKAAAPAGGFSLIEVLVAITIVMVGLLGLAGMQARAQVAEFESYQRAQALVLLYDMIDRLNNNRTTASCFAITTSTRYYGDNLGTPTCSAGNPADNALAVAAMTAWDSLLQGTAEKKGASATNVGAMIGARGCVTYAATTEYVAATTGIPITGTGEYMVAVSWQGMAATFPPTKSCGSATQYGSESQRRTVWATMRIGTLLQR